MITLHHLEYSQSFRVLWLLDELGVDYDFKVYQRDKKTMLAPDEYKAISPLGTAPVITDGDTTLAETSAILDYIIDQNPNDSMRPPAGADNRAQYLFWLHASQGSLMPVALMSTLFTIMEKRVPFFMKPMMKMISFGAKKGFINPRMEAILVQAEDDLSRSDFFAGDDLTLADILMSYPIDGLQTRGQLDDYPNLQAWLSRVQARDAYKSAMEKDGKDTVILPL